MEEVAEEDAFARQQRLEETASVELEQPRRDVAAVFGGDAAVVGVEDGGFGAEDGHVAIEEMHGVGSCRIIHEVIRRELAMRAVRWISSATRFASTPASGSQRAMCSTARSAERASLSLRPAS